MVSSAAAGASNGFGITGIFPGAQIVNYGVTADLRYSVNGMPTRPTRLNWCTCTRADGRCRRMLEHMASPAVPESIPQRLTAIRDQLQLLSDYL